MAYNAKYSVDDIAQWFINRGVADVGLGGELITPLKLQKLLYYAQGSHLALKDKPLFDDNIFKWRYGPVVKGIYAKYADFGDSGIDDAKHVEIDKDTEEILEIVYDVFGQFTALKLSEMTHKEKPWMSASDNCVISNLAIKKYFIENYVEA